MVPGMTVFRSLWLILTLLVFASGSVTMAVARNQPRAVGAIELCTGYGLVSVAVDANGNPTGPLMPCPDATQALAALTDTSVPFVATPGALSPVRYRLRDLASTVVPACTHRLSRAPPVRA